MFDRPTIRDVIDALAPLAHIPRPYTDNEGDPINGDSVLPYLSAEHAQLVRHAAAVVYEYARTADCEPDRRALNTMTRHGFHATLNPAQYEPDRQVGGVTVGNWYLDISDVPCGGESD